MNTISFIANMCEYDLQLLSHGYELLLNLDESSAKLKSIRIPTEIMY